VLGALGVGGYFAYTNYIEPMLNPYSKLIPEGLREYAKGKNADAFLVLKNDQDIRNAILSKSPDAVDQVTSFEGALAVVNTTKMSGAIVMAFATPEKAAELKTLAESQKTESPIPYTFEQKGKVLIASFGGGLDAMEGPLLDNPSVKKLDVDMLDSQLVAYAAVSQMGQLGTLISNQMSGMFSSAGLSDLNAALPVAHAQGIAETAPDDISLIDDGSSSNSGFMAVMSALSMAPFIDDAAIYARYRNSEVNIKAEIRLLARNALAEAPLIKNTLLKSGDMKPEDLETAYAKALEMAPTITSQLQTMLDEQTRANKGSTARLSYGDYRFTLTINFSKEIAETMVQDLFKAQTEAPKRGRDAARKANLNMITTAIEAYNLDKDEYPASSACVENLDMLKPYLQGGKAPGEVTGEVKGYELKMDDCESNYYYQSFGDKGYVLWAKMELTEDGNTSLTPQEFESGVASGTVPPMGEPGTYYMLNKSYIAPGTSLTTSPSTSETPATTPTKKPRVKRTSN
jgi:hypothetical protein